MSDEYINEHFLLRTPIQTAIILLSYLYFVSIYGPSYMKGRKPYKLRNLVLTYNGLQIFMNLYILYKLFDDISKNNYEYKCLIASRNMVACGYTYYLVKICDLFETIIFVLKKKHNQISFLHVYHHVVVLSYSFFGLKSIAVGHALLYGIINCFVHTIMYMYYFISAYNPSSELVKMKKFVTQIQLFQFFILLIHYTWPLIFGHCCLPQTYIWLGITQALLMMYLFGKFYINTYLRKNTTKL